MIKRIIAALGALTLMLGIGLAAAAPANAATSTAQCAIGSRTFYVNLTHSGSNITRIDVDRPAVGYTVNSLLIVNGEGRVNTSHTYASQGVGLSITGAGSWSTVLTYRGASCRTSTKSL